MMDQTAAERKKTPEQILAIKEVQRAAEAAMDAVVSYVRSNDTPTSEEAHAIIDTVLAEHDCVSPEGHIVAGGEQSAEPHEKGSGPLESGKPIVIDIYPQSTRTGYFADMSRTICKGTPPPELQKMYDVVLAAQERATSMVRPGVRCSDLHKAVDALFVEQGYRTSGTGAEFTYAEGFVHALGHGVGREVHEAPSIGPKSTSVLEAGNVITIEPGLYYKHIGGVRLEDMVLVTENGVENLATLPKQLQV